MKRRNIFSWVLIVPFALLFGLAGISKLGGTSDQMFVDWGFPAWFALVIGVIEVLGAVGLLVPRTTKWAVWGLSVVMIGAVGTHIMNGEFLSLLRPVIFSAAIWGGLYLREGAGKAEESGGGS